MGLGNKMKKENYNLLIENIVDELLKDKKIDLYTTPINSAAVKPMSYSKRMKLAVSMAVG